MLTLSKASKRQLDDWGINNAKVMRFWCDLNLYRPKQFTVMFIGRPLKIKGINIVKQVEQKMRELDFIYVTDMPKKYVPYMYRLADIVVVPSLYNEAYGLVAMEALACGVPVIASNRGGLKEIAPNEDFMMLIEPLPSILENAIWIMVRRLLMDKNLKEKCRAYALQHFHPINAEIILNEYRKA